MRLFLIHLVLCWYFSEGISYPLSQPENIWKRSRYIIDNRRNLLFNKPFQALYANATPVKSTHSKFTNVTYEKNDKPFVELEKDFQGETYFENENYNDGDSSKNLFNNNKENFLCKIKGTIQIKNYTDVDCNTQNLVQREVIREIIPRPKSVISVNHYLNTDEQILKWNTNKNENFHVTNAHTAGPLVFEKSLVPTHEMRNRFHNLNLPRGKFDFSESRNDFEFAPIVLFTTTPSNFWAKSNRKIEPGIRIDKNAEPEEKHVYETRIETVSYHREVIFNSPQKKSEKNQELYNEQDENYRNENTENLTEKNYEEDENNYEEEEKNYEEAEENYEKDEKNYEVDESIHVMTNGRFHGSTNSEVEDNSNKFGFIVEGKNYKRYRVEEKTPDGFIVGEYGVVSHNDGSLRGVRYTADSTANPQLIYQALINFLSL